MIESEYRIVYKQPNGFPHEVGEIIKRPIGYAYENSIPCEGQTFDKLSLDFNDLVKLLKDAKWETIPDFRGFYDREKYD
jgi:hypothetical protein